MSVSLLVITAIKLQWQSLIIDWRSGGGSKLISISIIVFCLRSLSLRSLGTFDSSFLYIFSIFIIFFFFFIFLFTYFIFWLSIEISIFFCSLFFFKHIIFSVPFPFLRLVSCFISVAFTFSHYIPVHFLFSFSFSFPRSFSVSIFIPFSIHVPFPFPFS